MDDLTGMKAAAEQELAETAEALDDLIADARRSRAAGLDRTDISTLMFVEATRAYPLIGEPPLYGLVMELMLAVARLAEHPELDPADGILAEGGEAA